MFGRLLSGPTVGQRMTAAGRASGFDYLRLSLSVLILFWHALTQPAVHNEFITFMYSGPGRVVRDILIPMFFGLGGFLVAGSLDRVRSLITYLGLRVLRIFPALWVDVLVSALLIGPLLTTLPLADYFSHPVFWKYFLNLVGEIQYFLPGVFESNPDAKVNGQLWTVPWDLLGYVLLSLFTLIGLYASRRRFLVLAVASQAGFVLGYLLLRYLFDYHTSWHFLVVVPCFLTGVAFHQHRDRIPWNGALAALSMAFIAVALLIDRRLIVLLPFPILYLTVYLGAFNPRRTWIIASGDYSYGIFLYHRALQQALWLLVPFAQSWYGNFILSLPLSFAFAYLSWHLVERNALSLKDWLMARDDHFARAVPFMLVIKPTRRLSPA